MVKLINEYLEEWSKTFSIPVADIEKDYQKFLLEENEIHKDLSEDDKKQRALHRTALLYKRLSRSAAVGFEGILIGASDAVDVVARKRKAAIDEFNKDPQNAISQGLVNEEGTPLDNLSEWSGGRPNPKFGTPLPEHSYLRNYYGIAVNSRVTDDKPKFFTMTINGDKAQDENIPTFKPVRFMAIDKTQEADKETLYALNSCVLTKFTVDEELKLPEFENLVKQLPYFVGMDKLEETHQTTQTNFNRIAIVEGSVSSLNLEPTSFGSRVMSIENEDLVLENIDAKGITCWIPERIDVDFAEGSKVLVVGRTGQGKKKDEAGNITEELGDVTINVFGVYAIPKFRIELPSNIVPLTENDI